MLVYSCKNSIIHLKRVHFIGCKLYISKDFFFKVPVLGNLWLLCTNINGKTRTWERTYQKRTRIPHRGTTAYTGECVSPGGVIGDGHVISGVGSVACSFILPEEFKFNISAVSSWQSLGALSRLLFSPSPKWIHRGHLTSGSWFFQMIKSSS